MEPAGVVVGGGVDVPRRQSLSETRPNSTNLRDFLNIKEDDNVNDTISNNDNNRRNSVTLGAVLRGNKRTMSMPVQSSNRTLFDIIRDEPGGAKPDGKKSWKHFREKLKLRRAGSGSVWTSTVPVPASDMPLNPNSNRLVVARRHSDGFQPDNANNDFTQNAEASSAADMGFRSRSALLQRNSSRAVDGGSARFDNLFQNNGGVDAGDEEEERGESAAEGGQEGGGPVRMSLMALLAETDREMGLDGSAYMMDDNEEDEEEEEEIGGRETEEYNNCCVCMVRHKGAAFIPCGHTFCRLCSRELWVQRGNCPLCNNLILEILDIF